MSIQYIYQDFMRGKSQVRFEPLAIGAVVGWILIASVNLMFGEWPPGPWFIVCVLFIAWIWAAIERGSMQREEEQERKKKKNGNRRS